MAVETRSQKKAQSKLLKKRRSTRKRKVSINTIKNSHDFFGGPNYTVESRPAGGKCTKAILGPWSLNPQNSDAKSTLPSGISLARDTHKDYTFIAGHLLNAQLGGPGTDYKNLTILTSSANSKHYKNFEQNIIQAVDELKKLYEIMSENYIDIQKVKHGIEVEIRVSNQKWGKKAPDSYIAKSLLCTAKISTNITTVLTEEEQKHRSVISQVNKINVLVNKANNTTIDNTR